MSAFIAAGTKALVRPNPVERFPAVLCGWQSRIGLRNRIWHKVHIMHTLLRFFKRAGWFKPAGMCFFNAAKYSKKTVQKLLAVYVSHGNNTRNSQSAKVRRTAFAGKMHRSGVNKEAAIIFNRSFR